MKYYGTPSFNLGREDLIKVATGAAIAAAGAGLTYLSQWATGQDFGVWTPMVVAVLSAAVNAFRKWATDTT